MTIVNTSPDSTQLSPASDDALLACEAPQHRRLRWFILLLCGLLAGLIVGILTNSQAGAAPAEALGSCSPAYLRQIDQADSGAAPALPALGLDLAALSAQPQAEAAGTDCAIR
jgi:hypothetical protein